MSPEVYSSDCPFDGHAIDIWACGVILFIMLTGVPPFDVASTRDQRFNIIQRGGMVGMLRGWGMNMSEVRMTKKIEAAAENGAPWNVTKTPLRDTFTALLCFTPD